MWLQDETNLYQCPPEEIQIKLHALCVTPNETNQVPRTLTYKTQNQHKWTVTTYAVNVKENMYKKANYNIWLLAIVIFVMGLAPTLSGAAFAQTYTDADNPHGPMQVYAWGGMAAITAIMSGAGIVTIFRKK